MPKKKEVIEKVKPKKKKAVKKPVIEEKPEAVYIYHKGDNISKIAEILTGHQYMEYAILNYSGLNMNQLKDGDILKWGL